MEKSAKTILDALGFHDGELSILIVDDRHIQKLNRKHLNKQGPTNVIAFPMQAGDFSNINPQLLGDVVISIETARNEGNAAGVPTETRLLQLLVHGILHLFGYDHETTTRQAHRMERKSNQLLDLLEHTQD
jgi:probable rRNA maturation factor